MIRTGRGLAPFLCAVLGCLTASCSSSSGNPMIAMVPIDREVEAWVRTGPLVRLDTVNDFYNLIDGAAQVYVDHGWVASVYATFDQSPVTLAFSVHDMGSDANAKSFYDYYRPVAAEPLAGFDNAVVDIGSNTSYAGLALADHYIVQVVIGEHSDAVHTSIQKFLSKVLERYAYAKRSS